MYVVKADRVKTKLDQSFIFANDIELANYIYGFKNGWQFPEYPLVGWCKDEFVSSDKAFIDIGAHIGTWSFTLGEKADHVYSFECNKEVYNCLCANTFLKGLSMKTDTYNCALSNSEGEATYYIRSTDGGGNGIEAFPEMDKRSLGTRTVKTYTLDSFDLKNIGFIKIDVEGHEKEVLQGALKTLEDNDYPKFIFESWPDYKERDGVPAKELRESLFNYIESLEYKITPVRGFNESFLATR